MDEEDAPSNFKPTDYIKSDINILLLGESGVGKSTFINSLANYLQHTTLDAAISSNNIICLIPTKFPITDENFVEKIIEFGIDNNEDNQIGNSSTQGTRAYVFPLAGEDRKIRLIDTPGIGDARGIEQDQINFENILSYISQFKQLHAICFLLKPNVSVINAYFKFCIMHLLSRLEKTASKNIVFIFTNSRSSFYRPGETLPVLKRILNEIKSNAPDVDIPCSKDNMFCLDNEAFKFLIALKNNVSFGEREKNEFSVSWQSSVSACWKLLSYITGDNLQAGLVPHEIQNTLSVNEARRIIIDLSRPLADITDLVQDNLTILKRHQDTILEDNLTINELQKSLYIPSINLRQKSLSQPVTVCTASKCTETCVFAGIKKYHYKQRCHNPCYLPDVPQVLIGAPQLLHCSAIGLDKQCIECKCDFSTHMHILYETETYEDKLEDDSVKTKINNKEDMITTQYKMITKLQGRKGEYENEKTIICQSMAKFAHFLKKNSISTYNDAFEDYIEYLIDRENALGPNKDRELIKRYEDLKKQHVHEKNVLDSAVVQNIESSFISAQDVFDCVEKLYSLKHTGKKIRELHKKQQQVRKSEHEKTMEYCHPEPIQKPGKKNKAKKTIAKVDLAAQVAALTVDDSKGGSKVDKTQLMELVTQYFKQQEEETDVNTNTNANKNTSGGAFPKNTKKLNNAAVKNKNVNQNTSGNLKRAPNKFENNPRENLAGKLKNNLRDNTPPNQFFQNPNYNQFNPQNFGPKSSNSYQMRFNIPPPQGNMEGNPNFPRNVHPQYNPQFNPNINPNMPNFNPHPNQNAMPQYNPYVNPNYNLRPAQGESPFMNPQFIPMNTYRHNSQPGNQQQAGNKKNRNRGKNLQPNPVEPHTSRVNKKGAQFKKRPAGKNNLNRNKSNDGNSSDSDNVMSNITAVTKKEEKPKASNPDLEMMKHFLEQQKKLKEDNKKSSYFMVFHSTD